MTSTQDTDWPSLLSTWDQQQSGYLRHREQRFSVVLDALAQLDPAPQRILDLGCGPGSFAARLLGRFSTTHVVALDNDPVLLRLGSAALGDADGRLSWVDADLRRPGWTAGLGDQRFDAAVSSTALHWLGPAQLSALYATLAQLVRPGGWYFDADNLTYDQDQPTFTALADQAVDQHSATAFGSGERADWDTWWDRLLELPDLADARVERDRRTSERLADEQDHLPLTRLTSVRFHLAALREAGFREVGTIWQDYDDRVLLGVR